MRLRVFGSGSLDDTVDDGPAPTLDDPTASVQPAARRHWGRLLHRAERVGVREFATPASTRIFLVLFMAAMLCGPAALVMASTSRPAPVVSAAAPSTTPSARDQLRAGAAAVGLVRVWLSAGADDEATVVSMMGRDPGPFTLPANRSPAPAWLSVSDATPTKPGEWTVVVVAGSQTGGVSYYSVLVAVTPQQAAAMTLPAPMPQPRLTADATDLGLLSTGDPRTVTATGFVTSLLTGADDMSRWLTPDSTVQPTGRICRTVRVRRVESAAVDDTDTTPGPTATDLLATVDCQSAPDGSQVRTLQYPLTVQLRDGRWEVSGYASTLPTEPSASPGGDLSEDPAPSPDLPATADPSHH